MKKKFKLFSSNEKYFKWINRNKDKFKIIQTLLEDDCIKVIYSK